MGRLSGALTNPNYKTSSGGGRLSGIVTSEEAINEKNNYYAQIEKKRRYEEAVAQAEKLRVENEKAQSNLKFWETIADVPKNIWQAVKETGAGIADIATRIPGPLATVKKVSDVAGSMIYGKGTTQEKIKQGIQESEIGKTYFEKVSGEQLTNPDGSINWNAGRQFIGRAMEAPTYFYSVAKEPVQLALKGLVTRLLTRTSRILPEAGINTAIQQFEEGTLKTTPQNMLANALLMSVISNVSGEIKVSRSGIRNTIDNVEKEVGEKLSLTEKADIMEAVQQGVKEKEIIQNLKKIRTGEITPNELANTINNKFETPQSLKDLKPVEIPIEKLKSIKGDRELALKDFQAGKKSQTNLPVLVRKESDGSLTVLDGNGRIIEAQQSGKTTIPITTNENAYLKILNNQEIKNNNLKTPKIELPIKKTESPILKKVNTMLDEASKLDENLPTTTFKKEFADATEKISKDPQGAYNDAIFSGAKKSNNTKSAMQISLLENAKSKGDNKAISEIGMAMGRHGRQAGQEIAMFRALYEQDPMNRILVNFAKNKLANVESKFPKILKKVLGGEEGDIITVASKSIRKRANQLLDAQSIIDKFICK